MQVLGLPGPDKGAWAMPAPCQHVLNPKVRLARKCSQNDSDWQVCRRVGAGVGQSGRIDWHFFLFNPLLQSRVPLQHLVYAMKLSG